MNKNVLVVCATVIFIFIGSFGYAIERLSHNTTTTVSLLTLLFTQLGLLVAALGTFIKTDKSKQAAETAAANTDRMLNGDMETKIISVLNRIVPGLLSRHVPMLVESALAAHEAAPAPSEALADGPTEDPTASVLPEPPRPLPEPPTHPPVMGGGQVGG